VEFFCVIDHYSSEGVGGQDSKRLHSVEPRLVKTEVLAAGFELVAESDLLRNKEDDHTLSVFDKAIRGRTDRFLFKFIKPENKEV